MEIVQSGGSEALTFASLAQKTGLAPATLVQRFHNKADLKRAALLAVLQAIEATTQRLIAGSPQTPAGAIRILVGLSTDYGTTKTYARNLLIFREDIQDAAVRERAAAWKASLVAGLDACFAATPDAPLGVGLMLASQWQGSLVWWSFDPARRIDLHVAAEMFRLISAIASIEV